MTFWRWAHKYVDLTFLFAYYMRNIVRLFKWSETAEQFPLRSNSIAWRVVDVIIWIWFIFSVDLVLSLINIIYTMCCRNQLERLGAFDHHEKAFAFLLGWLLVTFLMITFCDFWVSLFEFLTIHQYKGAFIAFIVQ